MLHPLHSLFRRSRLTWEESDIKYYVQDYLRAAVKTEALYCDHVREGVAEVRVGSAAVHASVVLLEFDLIRAVRSTTSYPLQRLVVRVA